MNELTGLFTRLSQIGFGCFLVKSSTDGKTVGRRGTRKRNQKGFSFFGTDR